MGTGSSGLNGRNKKSSVALVDHPWSDDGYKMYDKTQLAGAERDLGYMNNGETDKWLASLTSDEISSIKRYSGKYYRQFNQAIRTNNLTPATKKNRKNIESALDKFELKETMVFTRGSSADLLGGAATVDAINAMVGKVVHDKSVTSATAAGTVFHSKVMYHILTHPGKGIGAYIKPVALQKRENEFLFNFGSAYMVRGGYKDSKGVVHCNLEYVGRG